MKQYICFLRWLSGYVYEFELLARPLDKLANLNKPGKLEWNDAKQILFDALKNGVARYFKCSSTTPDGKYCLMSDCCDIGGAWTLLQQQWDNINNEYRWYIIKFKSLILPRNIRNRHITIREFWIAVNGVQYNKPYLLGKPFYLVVDHKNLIYFLRGTTIKMEDNQLLCRLRASLSMYDYYIFWNVH